VTYEADLWACIHTRSDVNCHGFRYVERGEDPGPCGHTWLRGFNQTSREELCEAPMYFVGTFVLTAEEGTAA
jgi:hypothetical protein